LNQSDPILAREPAPPILVMTSGNFGEKPIAADNKYALEQLSPLADAFLLHNRDIHIRSDDSVVRIDRGNPVYLRRSRGYAPFRVELPFEVKPVLAVGGERENAFCLAEGHEALLSPHIGDMQDAETQETFEQNIQHLSHTFHVEPEILAHDLHPDYFTTHFAGRAGLDLPHIRIQHHHAHIAACMADNNLSERQLIGLCFDESGYGLDGAVWGGEVLLASYADFERFAHLEYLPLPGGDPAICSPWRLAVAYTYALGIDVHGLPFLQNLDRQALQSIRQQVDRKLNVSFTSSVCHLFDAVASLIGIRNEITYEEQAVIEMAVLSKSYISTASPYPYSIEETDHTTVIRLQELLSGMVQDLRVKQSIGLIGARFHKTVAEIAIEACRRARAKTKRNEVALSGSVWQNQLLLDLVRDGLGKDRFTVYFHRQVPTNDGGLALGQAVIAGHAHRLAMYGQHVGTVPG
jgi:hydrogenase maturation protein HypF